MDDYLIVLFLFLAFILACCLYTSIVLICNSCARPRAYVLEGGLSPQNTPVTDNTPPVHA